MTKPIRLPIKPNSKALKGYIVTAMQPFLTITAEHLDRIEALCRAGGGSVDADTARVGERIGDLTGFTPHVFAQKLVGVPSAIELPPSRETLSGAEEMKGWPPQPGFTDMQFVEALAARSRHCVVSRAIAASRSARIRASSISVRKNGRRNGQWTRSPNVSLRARIDAANPWQ